MADTDEALVQSAQKGDRGAFEELVRRTSRLVFARLYLETGDAHRAEDLSQEAFLVAFRSLHRLQNPSGFRAWLLKIAQTTAIDAARRDLRKKRSGTASAAAHGLDSVASQLPGPAEQAEQGEVRQKVLTVLRSLPEDYRLPLTLRYISDADYETIKIQLGLSNGALRGLLHRGLRMLRERLQQTLGDEPFRA
jgi:RNA polymerase sigma-70 factor (ECF subfamily)